MKTLLLPFLLSFAFLVQAQTPDTATVQVEIDSLIKLNNSLSEERQFDEAMKVLEQAKEKCMASFGEESPLYAKLMFFIGRIYYNTNNFPPADSFFVIAKTIQEATVGKEHPDYAWTIDNMGMLNTRLGNFEKAVNCFLEAKSIREKTLGKEHRDYASSLNNLAVIYYHMGRLNEVKTLLEEAASLRAKLLGKDHPRYAWSLNNLAVVNMDMGNHEIAEPLFLEARKIWFKAHGEDHPDYVMSLNNLANLYMGMGRYEEVEPLRMEVKRKWKIALGDDHPDYAMSLDNLAVLYTAMGNFEKAEPIKLEAVEIYKKQRGADHPEYAFSLHNLALLYHKMDEFTKAEAIYLESKSIIEKAFGKEHQDYCKNLVNLAALYMDMGKIDVAESLLLEAKTIFEEHLDFKVHSSYVNCLRNLGLVYSELDQLEKAEPFFVKAKNISEKSSGTDHPEYAENAAQLGEFHWYQGEFELARPLLAEANTIEKTYLIKAARHLSERELTAYTLRFSQSQNLHFSFAQADHKHGGTAYDNSLFYKGFLLNTAGQINTLALRDSSNKDNYYLLKSSHRQLASEYTKPVSERDNAKIAALEEKVSLLEKNLAKSAAGFGNALQQVSWQEILAQLQPKEAAIEFVHYQFSNPDKTDSIMYAAILLRPGFDSPQYIPLFEEKSLDSLFLPFQQRRADYVNNLYLLSDRGLLPDEKPVKSLYQLIWQPLEEKLNGVENIYWSPSGLLHRINLNAIPLDDETTIADLFKTVQLSSTRTLVIADKDDSENNTAVLYGGIEYESDSLAIITANEDYLDDRLASRGMTNDGNFDIPSRGQKWNFLKWTQKEVETIHEIVQTAGFKSEVRSDYNATEESLLAIGRKEISPKILHIATHGYFFPDPKEQKETISLSKDEPVFKISDHPMIRSGLIMAGGNHVWQGKTPIQNMEDGILTAYEISQMNLSNTELVVLSACETGLGDIEGNEGVYGLQRAFKIAGAKYLIMSLWQVPDRPTKDFMETFYRHWLEDQMTIPDAFRKTQQEMKERFYDPYQWAGFVLVE